MKIQAYLQEIDELINKGPYKDNWASLSTIGEPEWYKNAKFGIFIHWGVYSVPAFGSEWYPRHMYIEGTKEYEHHIKTYGQHKDFGYADFVPLFKAEKFNPEAWADLFKASGAKYVMPVAEHHDGFQMYDSDLSEWNALKMGPKKDLVGMIKTEVEKQGMVFCGSSHRAENYWFMCGGRDFDSGIQVVDYEEPYGYCKKLFSLEDQHEVTHNIHSEGPSTEHLEDWLVRSCEFVDRYQPKVVWFDWWIQNVAFKPYLKKFAAYYYNRALEWGVEVAINYKEDAYAKGTAIFDVERGQLANIRPRFWQTDTAVAKNSWGYTENNDFKTPEAIVCDLVDIVSKNGCMLLNIGPRADGTITEEDAHVLRAIGKWLKVNGDAIYNTTYWSTYGEGPTDIVEGTFNDVLRKPFTPEDLRFTYKAPYIYANVLQWPADGQVTITSMAQGNPLFKGDILSVDLLGYEAEVAYSREKEGLVLKVNESIETSYPVCFRIRID